MSVANRLDSYIGKSEVLTSTDLADRMEAGGVNRVLARQWMSRDSDADGIWRSKALELSGRVRLFSRWNHVGSPAFLTQAAAVLAEGRPGLSRVIRRLLATGVVLRSDAEKLLAAPRSQGSAARFCTFDDDVAALDELRAGKLDGNGTALERLAKPSLHEETAGHALAMKQHGTVLLQSQIARMLVDHFRRQGLIAWQGYDLPADGEGNVYFNDFPFSASSFSWLNPLLRWSSTSPKPLPAPVVIDVVARGCDELDVEAFAHRIQRAKGNPKNGLKILGVLAAFDFAKAAWNLSKEHGFLCVNLRQAFGNAAVETMEKMRELLTFVGGDPDMLKDGDLDSLATNLDQLKSNPYVTELKSIAFEIWATLYLRISGYENIHTNLLVPFNQTKREVDASGIKPAKKRAYLIECKAEGESKDLDPDYVDKFFKETVPAYLADQWKGKPPEGCKAQIWTTGKVGQAAKDRLGSIKLKSFIKPKLVDSAELETMVPAQTSSARRLIKNIGVA